MSLAGRNGLCFLAVAYFILQVVPYCFSKSIVIEVPGYAKAVVGAEGGVGHAYWGDHRPFYSFRSLFYASKITNETRFLPPVPSNYPYPDDVIYNAINPPPGCPQGGDYHGEDCLILSVYTPYFPGNASDPLTTYDKNLPVMFWIHGGSFDSGQNLIYVPHTYMTYDVVIVEVQYRLGPLGYLSLDTDEIPGNAGMFDQIEGLRWVNKFIKYFGGDPNAVTVVGESAGAASASFLMLAPQARGLFRYAIMESGSMLAEWALDRHPRKTGLRIAEFAECPLEPYEELLYCLRNMDEVELRRAQQKYSREDGAAGGLGFGGQSPIVQTAGKERALTREPKELFESGDYATDVRVLMGANKHEGLFGINYIYRMFIRPNNLINDTEFLTNDAVPMVLKALGIDDPSGALSEAMTKKYFGYCLDAGTMGNWTEMIPGMIDMSGTLFLKAGGWEFAHIHTKWNPNSAFWYSFDYRSRFTILGMDEMFPPGVNHADEIMFLFTMPFRFNESEAILAHRMQSVWTTFATHGDPTPEGSMPLELGVPKFMPYNTKDKPYMHIDEDWEIRSDFTTTYTITVDEMLAGKEENNKRKRNGVTAGKNKMKAVTDVEKIKNAENRVIISLLQKPQPIGE